MRPGGPAAQRPGFLAADRINQPYALCPWELPDNAAMKAGIARDPAIVRAMALYQLGELRPCTVVTKCGRGRRPASAMRPSHAGRRERACTMSGFHCRNQRRNVSARASVASDFLPRSSA